MLLDVLGIVRFKGVAVNSAGTLEFASEANGGGQFDDGGFIFDCLGGFNSGLHGVDVMITVFDVLSVPSFPLHLGSEGYTHKLRIVSKRPQ